MQPTSVNPIFGLIDGAFNIANGVIRNIGLGRQFDLLELSQVEEVITSSDVAEQKIKTAKNENLLWGGLGIVLIILIFFSNRNT